MSFLYFKYIFFLINFYFSVRDSWASKQSGILEGNVRWSGHYYECINSETSTFRGKYCSTFFGATFIVGHKSFTIHTVFKNYKN